MTLPKIVISNKKSSEFKGDLLVVFVCLDKKEKTLCSDEYRPLLKQFTVNGDFKGKSDESLLLYPPFSAEGGSVAAKRLMFIGLGRITTKIKKHELYEKLRSAGGDVAKMCKKAKLAEIAITLPACPNITDAVAVRYLIEGTALGVYSFASYRKKEKDDYRGLQKIVISDSKSSSRLRQAVELGRNSVSATYAARNMANEPGNRWTPTHFAAFAEDLAAKYDFTCKIMEKNEMVDLGMGGILAVNQGSHEAPKLVILEYTPENPKKTVMFVGKGLTFDSGGISLKPAQGMMDMKYDMCGGAAALSAMQAVGRERPACRVICLVPSTDNMAGGGAVKPGDVITHYGGITSEIENTDAEGRLILADALAYGIEKFKPDAVIDLATLTGAVIIALGHHYTGLLCNDKGLTRALLEAASLSGEPAWQLPLDPLFAKQIKSEVADIKNTGGRPGGTITAAEYLHKFVGKTPWAHLDIAGTAWDFTEKSYVPKGPTGTGARTLIEYIRSL